MIVDKVALGRRSLLEPIHTQVKVWFEARRSAAVEVRKFDILIQFLYYCDVKFEM